MENTNKNKKKNIPRSIHEMSKEMLQETLKKKKECNAKALLTVEKLCEVHVSEEWFLENLQYINQCHFEDATVERAITKLCGYPLCTEKLGKIPSQQYHISTRYNKVYDITERKNFCSSSCYRAAMYIKNQLFTSPLWFRNQETIPKYVILKSSKTSLGEEVVFFPDKILLQTDNVEPEKKDECGDVFSNLENKNSHLATHKIDISKSGLNNKNDKNNDEIESISSNISQIFDKLDVKENKSENANILGNDSANNKKKVNNVTDCQSEEILNENVKPKEVNTESSISENVQNLNTVSNKLESVSNNISQKRHTLGDSKTKTKSESVDCVTKVETSIFEWFSVDTMLHLFSELKLKEILSDKADEFKEVLKSKPVVLGSSKKIDKMLQLFEVLNNDCFSDNEKRMNLKPLPDYSALKEEGKKLEIKVRAFYKGDLNIKEPPKEESEVKEDSQDENSPIFLPLVDAHAQQALRRKIVLDKLNRILPELLRIFSTDYILQMGEVRNLVSTFSLGPHNITFKPSEWYLVGLILIKLLSFKDRHLELILELESSEKQMALLLMSFELPQNYLHIIIQKLTSSDNIIKNFNTY